MRTSALALAALLLTACAPETPSADHPDAVDGGQDIAQDAGTDGHVPGCFRHLTPDGRLVYNCVP